jgi:hypothetical protein
MKIKPAVFITCMYINKSINRTFCGRVLKAGNIILLDKHGQILSVYVCSRAMCRTVDTIAGFQNARSLGPQA